MSLGISDSSMSETRRADTPPGSRAERSGDVALGTSDSSMSELGKTNRRAIDKQSGAGISRSASAARR